MCFTSIPMSFTTISMCFTTFPMSFTTFPMSFTTISMCVATISMCFTTISMCYSTSSMYFFTAISMGMIRKSRLLPSKVSKFRLERKVLTSVKTVNSFCLILTRNSLKSLNQFSHFPNACVSLFVCLGIPLPSVQTTPAYVCDFD